MKLTKNIVLEVASHEAIVRQAYKDSVGKWTWSVGLTSATGHNVERYIDKPQAIEHCLSIYIWALDRYAREVDEAFAPKKLTEEQKAAALSFHWNTGAIGRAAWVKDFKEGRFTLARKNFMAYSKPKAIIPRRTKERDLFFDGKWSNDGTITEFTRLTANHTPVWSSGVKLKIDGILDELLREQAPAKETAPKDEGNFLVRFFTAFWKLLTGDL